MVTIFLAHKTLFFVKTTLLVSNTTFTPAFPNKLSEIKLAGILGTCNTPVKTKDFQDKSLRGTLPFPRT